MEGSGFRLDIFRQSQTHSQSGSIIRQKQAV